MGLTTVQRYCAACDAGLDDFRDSEAVYDGLMVRFTLSTALTVQIDPKIYLESNRKLGSKSRYFGLPPYFYFLFGPWGTKNDIFGRFLAGVAPRGAYSQIS